MTKVPLKGIRSAVPGRESILDALEGFGCGTGSWDDWVGTVGAREASPGTFFEGLEYRSTCCAVEYCGESSIVRNEVPVIGTGNRLSKY